jgi:hypothetical protein
VVESAVLADGALAVAAAFADDERLGSAVVTGGDLGGAAGAVFREGYGYRDAAGFRWEQAGGNSGFSVWASQFGFSFGLSWAFCWARASALFSWCPSAPSLQ